MTTRELEQSVEVFLAFVEWLTTDKDVLRLMKALQELRRVIVHENVEAHRDHEKDQA